MAPVFILCWPLFPNTERGMYLALSSKSIGCSIAESHVVPLLFTIVFWIVGNGFISSDMIVKTMSRSGRASELSIGPVHYGLIMTLVTYLFWKKVDAVFIIMTVSFGDGFAACFGTSSRMNKPLWWNKSKSWLGLASYILFSAAGIIGVCAYLHS